MTIYASRFNTVEYDASHERLVDAVLAHPGSATLPRAGKRPGTGLEVTTGGGPEAATVAAGAGVVVDTSGGGGYFFSNTAPVDLVLAARPGVGNSRIDFVVARVKNEDARPGDTDRQVEFAIVQGTAGASPTAPTIPAGQLRLARLTIPSSGSIVVTQPAQRTAAAGGVILVADATERDAISPMFDGIMVYREDTDCYEGRVNGAWARVGPIDDTGWITLASATVTGTTRYRVRGGWIMIQAVGSCNTSSGTSVDLTSAAIPLAYRPDQRVRTGASFFNHPGIFTMETNGILTGVQQSGADRSTVSGVVTYPVNL